MVPTVEGSKIAQLEIPKESHYSVLATGKSRVDYPARFLIGGLVARVTLLILTAVGIEFFSKNRSSKTWVRQVVVSAASNKIRVSRM